MRVYQASPNSLIIAPNGTFPASTTFNLVASPNRTPFWLHCDSPNDYAIGASYYTYPGNAQISVPNQSPSGHGWLFNVINTTPGGAPIQLNMAAICLKTQ